MGSMVNAKCQCGVDKQVSIGGGRMSFMTTCNFPCHCGKCHNVVKVNLLESWWRRKCPECGSRRITPYDHPSLAGSPGENEVASWNMREELGRELKLTDGNYKCPRCGQITLRFERIGFFD